MATNYRVTIDFRAEADDDAKTKAAQAAKALNGKVSGVQAEKLAFRAID